MRLQRLTGLEQDKITGEYREVMDQIVDLLDILAQARRASRGSSRDELTAIRDAVRRQAPLARSSRTAQDLSHRGPDHAARTWS